MQFHNFRFNVNYLGIFLNQFWYYLMNVMIIKNW